MSKVIDGGTETDKMRQLLAILSNNERVAYSDNRLTHILLAHMAFSLSCIADAYKQGVNRR